MSNLLKIVPINIPPNQSQSDVGINKSKSHSEEISIKSHTGEIISKDHPEEIVFQYESKLYWYAIACGYAMVAPYNAMVTVMYYFKEIYEPSGYTPEFTFPVVSYIPLVLVQLVLLAYDKKVPVFIKLVLTTAIMAISSFAMPFIGEYIENKMTSYSLQLAMCAIQNVGLGILEPACINVLGTLDITGRYINGVMVGISIGGVITAALQFMCIGIFGSDSNPFYSVILLFSIVFALMLGSVIISYLLLRHPQIQATIIKMPENKSISEIWFSALKILVDQGMNVALVYTFSFMVFPGVTIAKPIQSLPSQWSIPMIVFLFNLADTLGKLVSNYWKIISRGKLKWSCIARGIIPVLSCFVGYGSFNNLFVKDWIIVLVPLMLGFTNGLCGTFAMMYGGDLMDDKSLAGGLMCFYLTCGLLIGSILSQTVFANNI